MNPENNQENSGSYLDQISAPVKSKTDFLKQKPVMIGIILGVLSIITIILVIVAQIISGGTNSTEQLAAKLVSTKSTLDASVDNLESSKIRATNSSLKIYLTNTIRDITPILEKSNINIDKLSDKVTKLESNEELLATLEDARLNAVFDKTYAREMAYQLELTLNLMKKIEKSTRDDELKDFLVSAQENLSPIQEEFASFTSN